MRATMIAPRVVAQRQKAYAQPTLHTQNRAIGEREIRRLEPRVLMTAAAATAGLAGAWRMRRTVPREAVGVSPRWAG